MKLNMDSKLNVFSVMITRRCQFDCDYCRMERDMPDMDPKDLRLFIDRLLELDEKEIEIQFF
jgi:sulfatase maturation enzyme AslB (radical SAM superfamily)